MKTVGIIEIVLQEFSHNHQMFTVVEKIIKSKKVRFISVTVGRDITKELDFVNGLIKIVLIVFYNFYTKVRIFL